MAKIKLIIFDFDGTLADTFNLSLEYAEYLNKTYFKQKVMYKKKLRNFGARELLKKFGISILLVPFILKKWRNYINKNTNKVPVYKGMDSVIKTLKKKYKIGILTSNTKETVKKILKKNKIKGINFIISESSIFGKNLTLKKIARLNDLNKNEMIYIADEIRDIKSSKKAGMKIIAVTWGYNSKKGIKKEKPDFIAEKPKDIVKLIEKLK